VRKTICYRTLKLEGGITLKEGTGLLL
jgi:hypothetical protein